MSISTAYKAQEPNCPNPNPSPAKAKASSAELESPGQRCSVDSFCISSLPVKVFTRATQKTKKKKANKKSAKKNQQLKAGSLFGPNVSKSCDESRNKRVHNFN